MVVELMRSLSQAIELDLPLKFRSIPFVVLMGALFGVNMVVSRFATGQFEPLVFVSLRMTLATFFYLAVYLVRPFMRFPTSRRLWLHGGIFGVFGIAIPMTCFVSSLQYLSSGVVSLFQTLSPPVTVILAHFLLSDERMNTYKVIGVVIAFCGALTLFATGETGLAEFVHADLRGYAFVSMAVLSASAAGIYGRRFLRDDSNYDVSTIRMLISAAILIVIPKVKTTGTGK